MSRMNVSVCYSDKNRAKQRVAERESGDDDDDDDSSGGSINNSMSVVFCYFTTR